MFRYFGYGSNLSESSLRAKGVAFRSAQPAVLAGWRLAFDIPNFFAIEGHTGNIVPAPGAEVHGVVYECEDGSLAVLDELEALGVAYERQTVTVRTYAGEHVSTFVYTGIPDYAAPEDGPPSLRYRNILVRGARAMGLDPAYVERLGSVPVCSRPDYPPFEHPAEPSTILGPEQLAGLPLHTALAGAVFDMSAARKSHEYLQRLFSGRDVTLLMLKRMDSSDGTETAESVARGGLTEAQRDYLNDYLHEFAREYRYAGRLRYADHASGEHSLDLPRRLAGATRAAHTYDPSSINRAEDAVPARRVLFEAEQTNRRLGHENLGFLSEAHGFAPVSPPRDSLGRAHRPWDDAARSLTEGYRTLQLRRTLDALPLLGAGPDELPDEELLRAASVLAMLSHAYWHVETTPPDELPEALTRPWAEVRRRLGRPQEVLSYIDLIVYNWQLVDPHDPDPRRVENMRLMIPTVDNQEERTFYLTQTEILCRCSPIIGSVVRAHEAVANDDREALETELHLIMSCLKRVVDDSLLKINPNAHGPNFVDPVIWAKTVAPFAVPFRPNVQGPSGTSSPIFNLLDTFFGRKKHETFLGKEIRELRHGYPPHWQQLIEAVGEVSVTEHVHRVDQAWLTGLLKQAVEVYAGQNGFLGRHRTKVYGYLELAFKVGRNVTIGGFSGVFRDRTWDQVDSELEYSRNERMASFPHGAHHAYVKKVEATTAGGSETVRHVVLDVSEAGVRYQPGDRCAILPENGDALVERTLAALKASGDEECALPAEWRAAVRLRAGHEDTTSLPLRELLRYGRIRPLTLRIAEALHASSQSETLRIAIQTQTTERWELWDALEMLRREGFEPKQLLDEGSSLITRIVPPETFRPYSIASIMSDPRAPSASEIHLTVGRVAYEVRGPDDAGPTLRQGTASNFLADAEGRLEPVPFLVLHPPRFSLPTDPRTPVVLVAGGTGVGTFRSFVLERLRQPDVGPTWLLLSVRSLEHAHYQEEFQAAVKQGKLRMEVVFSRDGAVLPKKRTSAGGYHFSFGGSSRRHIEDVINGDDIHEELLSLLRAEADGGRGAHLYVCGHSRFGKTVHGAIKQVLVRGGEGAYGDREARAERTLRKMAAEGRYSFEIFTDPRSSSRTRHPVDVSEVMRRNGPDHGYWCVIEGLVYDLTEFVELHPGGSKVLVGYAGMDATQGYSRAHADRSEIDAMRAMYEIGAVRHLELKGIRGNVTRGGVTQSVALAALYREWVRLGYLVVEMENALRNDQSLQIGRVTRDEPVLPRSEYRLQRAAETHSRFLRSYLDPLSGPALEDLQIMTCGLLGQPSRAVEMSLRLETIRTSDRAKHTDAIPGNLERVLARQVNGTTRPHDPNRGALTFLVSSLERLDRNLLADLKRTVIFALVAFERYEDRTLEERGDDLLAALDSFADYIEQFHVSIRELFVRKKVKPTFIPAQSRPNMAAVTQFRSILSTTYWEMLEDDVRRVVLLRRSAVPVESLTELVDQNAQVIAQMQAEHREWGIVVDMRQAPSRNDPEFEGAMSKLRTRVSEAYARVALLVTSTAGMLQVNRLARQEGSTQWASQSEDAAIRFAQSGS